MKSQSTRRRAHIPYIYECVDRLCAEISEMLYSDNLDVAANLARDLRGVIEVASKYEGDTRHVKTLCALWRNSHDFADALVELTIERGGSGIV